MISQESVGGPSPMLCFIGLIAGGLILAMALRLKGDRAAAKRMLGFSAGFVVLSLLFSLICPWKTILTTYGKGYFTAERTADGVRVSIPSSGDSATWTDATTYNRIGRLHAVQVERTYTIWGKDAIGGYIKLQYDGEKEAKE